MLIEINRIYMRSYDESQNGFVLKKRRRAKAVVECEMYQ